MTLKKGPHKNKIDALIAQRKKHFEEQNAEELTAKLIAGDMVALSESITLLESKNLRQNKIGQDILKGCLAQTGKSIRIGITGVPGVGKSTFIERFGTYLVSIGKKVAVLAIDPSSEVSGGSILGDKTRMNQLAVLENAFIRPSASSGTLGGVAQKTRETILLCEAAGFDVILVETVGVGQSETEVQSMTDFFLLLMLAGAGDELQGIKRGIMEMADTILITKTDGKNVKMANLARAEYKNALHLFPAKANDWIPRVETVSANENTGIDKAWKIIDEFNRHTRFNGWKTKRRQEQQVYWMDESVKNQLLSNFYATPSVQDKIKTLKAALLKGEITSYQAAEEILTHYKNGK